MSDKYDEYFESQEANDDSKSDSRVALVLIIVFVVGFSGYLVNNHSDKNFSASSAAIQPNPAEVMACL